MTPIRSAKTLVGVDGCHGGWLAVVSRPATPIVAQVFKSFAELVAAVNAGAWIGVDIPIGLPDKGARACELVARQRLGRPRMSSVFSAPPRACLKADTYEKACQIRFTIEAKKMSRQAFGILPKIREVDRFLARRIELRARVMEVHPELSFAAWQGGGGLRHSKKTALGKSERRALIDTRWPGAVERLRLALRGEDYALDDLHDALAVLWSVSRWARGEGEFLGGPPPQDLRDRSGRILV